MLRSGIVIAIVAGLGVTMAVAEVLGPGRDAWQDVTFKGIPATEFMVQTDGTVYVIANQSSGLIHRELTKAERDKPILTWQWRVTGPVPATDLTTKGKDDRAVAVHLWFPEKSSNKGLFARLKRSFARMAGKPVPGKAISYTWGGDVPAGTVLINPFMKRDGVIIVLRPADAKTGRWFSERVDVLADFERAFGYRPAYPVALAISGDSDDTATHSRAVVRRVRFLDSEEGGD